MSQNARGGEPASHKRKRANLYIDEDFGAAVQYPGQESLSAFGLKLIDSRKSLDVSKTSGNLPSEYVHFSNPAKHHRKKRRKSSKSITLSDLNSVVDVDVLLKKHESNSNELNVQDDAQRNITDSSFKIERLPEPTPYRPPASEHKTGTPSLITKQPDSDVPVQLRQESSLTVASTMDSKAKLNGPNSVKCPSGSRSLKKGFFNFQLPSRIPKRPRPEQFNKPSKLPRPSALRQLQAVSFGMDSARPFADEDRRKEDIGQSESAISSALNKDPSNDAEHNQPILTDLRLQQQCGHAERNSDPGLPRNPNSAIKLLSGLPAVRRFIFLQHIYYFFNHNHLTMLIRLHNGEFIKYIEKWVVEAIACNDFTLLRALLLLLEVLPVTPSTHCKNLWKILKCEKISDKLVNNLFCRIGEKWQFLEHAIRIHKAHKDNRRTISFSDETETLEYSIFLPPDTVRKSKKSAVKGKLKLVLSASAVKDAPPQKHLSTLRVEEQVRKNARLARKPCRFDTRFPNISQKTDGISIDSSYPRPSLVSDSITILSDVPSDNGGEAISVAMSKDHNAGFDDSKSSPSGFVIGEILDDSQSLATTVAVSVPTDQESRSTAKNLSPCATPVSISNETADCSVSDGDNLIAVSLNSSNLSPQSDQILVSVSGDILDEQAPLQAATNSAAVATDSMNATTQEAASLNGVSVESMDALLTLVPSIVRDFSSLLLPQTQSVAPILPNPFLSSLKPKNQENFFLQT